MNMRCILLIMMICGICSSCATKKYGVYDVLHHDWIYDEFEVFLLKHNDSARYIVEHKGEVICEMEFSPEYIRAVVIPYLSRHGEIDSHSVIYSDDTIMTVRWISTEMGTEVLIDKDGDGLPELRVITDESGRRVERLETIITRESDADPPLEAKSDLDAGGVTGSEDDEK